MRRACGPPWAGRRRLASVVVGWGRGVRLSRGSSSVQDSLSPALAPRGGVYEYRMIEVRSRRKARAGNNKLTSDDWSRPVEGAGEHSGVHGHYLSAAAGRLRRLVPCLPLEDIVTLVQPGVVMHGGDRQGRRTILTAIVDGLLGRYRESVQVTGAELLQVLSRGRCVVFHEIHLWIVRYVRHLHHLLHLLFRPLMQHVDYCLLLCARRQYGSRLWLRRRRANEHNLIVLARRAGGHWGQQRWGLWVRHVHVNGFVGFPALVVGWGRLLVAGGRGLGDHLGGRSTVARGRSSSSPRGHRLESTKLNRRQRLVR